MRVSTEMAAEVRVYGEELVRELYDGSYRRLVGQITALTGSHAEAEDVVQEAFVWALGHPRALRRIDNPEAWLRTIAVNRARSRWRRLRRFTGLLSDLVPDAVADEPGSDRMDLVAAIRLLPRKQQETIALHHLADLPVDEVARTLGVPVGTVKARLSRGRGALAVLLGENVDSEEEVPRA